jgi:hypothetical protein
MRSMVTRATMAYLLYEHRRHPSRTRDATVCHRRPLHGRRHGLDPDENETVCAARKFGEDVRPQLLPVPRRARSQQVHVPMHVLRLHEGNEVRLSTRQLIHSSEKVICDVLFRFKDLGELVLQNAFQEMPGVCGAYRLLVYKMSHAKPFSVVPAVRYDTYDGGVEYEASRSIGDHLR